MEKKITPPAEYKRADGLVETCRADVYEFGFCLCVQAKVLLHPSLPRALVLYDDRLREGTLGLNDFRFTVTLT